MPPPPPPPPKNNRQANSQTNISVSICLKHIVQYSSIGKLYGVPMYCIYAIPVHIYHRYSERAEYDVMVNFSNVFFMFVIQHCFICRPSDSNVSKDAGIDHRTVEALALPSRRSNHSARSHPTHVEWIKLGYICTLQATCLKICLGKFRFCSA